jgi:low temperature requirement protein LtrA
VVEKKSLLRSPGTPREPAFLELFFDLVYVFALTQLTDQLTEHLNPTGALDALVLLLALWWIWVLTAWLCDQFSPHHPAIQVQVVFVMIAVLVMAIVIRSIDRYSLLFAITYLAINFVRIVFVVFGARGTDLPNRSKRAAFWFSLSAPLWIAGGLTSGWATDALWLLALAIDYISAALRWPTPKLGAAPGWELAIEATHLAERYRQLFTVVHLPPTISSAAATLVLAGRRVRHSPRSSAPTRTTVTSYLEVIGGAN